MELKIKRYSLQIVLDDDVRDVAFIEEVLGLKNKGDWIKLIRVNRANTASMGCIPYLETETNQ